MSGKCVPVIIPDSAVALGVSQKREEGGRDECEDAQESVIVCMCRLVPGVLRSRPTILN